MLCRVILFAREPIAGRVKSRLAMGIGSELAASLYRAILEDLAMAFGRLPHSLEIRYEAEGEPSELARIFCEPWRLAPQGDGDLGSRLTRAASRALADFPAVIICGTDAPLLQSRHISAALRALGHDPLTLCPARDGGFSLVGLTAGLDPGELFSGIPWSTPETRAALVGRADQLGVRWRLLEPVDDVDEPGDLAHLAESLESADPSLAPGTRAWLSSRRTA